MSTDVSNIVSDDTAPIRDSHELRLRFRPHVEVSRPVRITPLHRIRESPPQKATNPSLATSSDQLDGVEQPVRRHGDQHAVDHPVLLCHPHEAVMELSRREPDLERDRFTHFHVAVRHGFHGHGIRRLFGGGHFVP